MHIESVVYEIAQIADALRSHGQKVAVIISTDGESSDGNVAEALKPLINVSLLDPQQVVCPLNYFFSSRARCLCW